MVLISKDPATNGSTDNKIKYARIQTDSIQNLESGERTRIADRMAAQYLTIAAPTMHRNKATPADRHLNPLQQGDALAMMGLREHVKRLAGNELIPTMNEKF